MRAVAARRKVITRPKTPRVRSRKSYNLASDQLMLVVVTSSVSYLESFCVFTVEILYKYSSVSILETYCLPLVIVVVSIWLSIYQGVAAETAFIRIAIKVKQNATMVIILNDLGSSLFNSATVDLLG